MKNGTMTRLALRERATMIRSLASLDMPIGYAFAETIANGRVPARVPVDTAMNAIRARRLWDMVVDAYALPLDDAQVGRYAQAIGVRVNSKGYIGDARDILRNGWHDSPLLASVCMSHRLMSDGIGLFDPAPLPPDMADWPAVARLCIRRPEGGLTDAENERMAGDA